MLEELLHPIIVTSMFEETQQLKMGVVQVTIHLGTSPVFILSSTFSVLTGRIVPCGSGSIPILVFPNATSLIVQIDVLQKIEGTKTI